MTTDDTEALVTALNVLINSDDARHLYLSLMTVAGLRIAHQVWFSDDAAVLNPLLALARRNPKRLETLIEKVDAKRREALKAPLVDAPDDGFDKTEYMRQFMYEKRLRERRAAELENLQRDPKDRLIGRPRLAFMETQAAKWKAELDSRMKAARAALGGKRLPLETDRTLREQFWAGIDKALDDLEAEINRRGPRK